VSLARHLVGEIAETSGGLSTVITHRPVAGAPDELDEVDVDDHAEALLRFACGATGTLEASWLGKGYAWFDTGTHDSLLEAAAYVRTVEQAQGLKVGCLEEIAFRRGLIDDDQLLRLARPLARAAPDRLSPARREGRRCFSPSAPTRRASKAPPS